MKFQKLIYIIVAFLIAYVLITCSTVKIHKSEIERLRMRVNNLEIVVNHIGNKNSDEFYKPDIKKAIAMSFDKQ